MTTIYEAAIAGDVPTLVALAAADPAAVNRLSAEGWTALHLAAHFGKLDAARALVAQGAAVNAWSHNDLANQPIHAAAAGQRGAVVGFLLDSGAEINSPEHGGYTALHLAADNGDAALTGMLLARGADPTLRTDDGHTAADLATAKGHTAVAVLLAGK